MIDRNRLFKDGCWYTLSTVMLTLAAESSHPYGASLLLTVAAVCLLIALRFFYRASRETDGP